MGSFEKFRNWYRGFDAEGYPIVPRIDVNFGIPIDVVPSTEERELTPSEKRAVEQVVAALAVWDAATAPSAEIPKLGRG
jgi:hypothetical protein